MPLTPVQNQENDLGHKRINQLLHHQKFSNHYTPLHVLTKLEKKNCTFKSKKKIQNNTYTIHSNKYRNCI